MDDENLMRTSLQIILGNSPDIDVVATCDGLTALATVRRHRPDIVLLDIQMPHADGLTVLDELRALDQPPLVAMLTAFSDDEYVRAALSRGAAGYLLKNTDPGQLTRQVLALGNGERPLAPRVAATVIDGYLNGYLNKGPLADQALTAVAALTPREREALSLLGRGLTNDQIARHMGLAASTAKDHVRALLAKLGHLNRVQAAVIADRAGLLTAAPRRLSSADAPARLPSVPGRLQRTAVR